MAEPIHSLRPNVTLEQARAAFTSRGVGGALRRARYGPLCGLAELYIPYRIHGVHIQNAARQDRRIYGLDAVSGTLDLYGFDRLPQPEELLAIETRNRPPVTLDEAASQAVLQDKVRRLLFLGGFFRVRELVITVEPASLEVHVPYWIAFFGSAEIRRIAVMDAVRRSMEGAKARELVRAWLAA